MQGKVVWNHGKLKLHYNALSFMAYLAISENNQSIGKSSHKKVHPVF